MLYKFLAKTLIQPNRRPLVKNPLDYGMKYQDIDFKSKDGTNLKAWFIPGNSDKLIIMTHPMPFNRYGFHTKGQGLFKVSRVEVELLKTDDPWTDPSDVQSFYDRTPAPKEIFWIKGDLERFDGYNYLGDRPESMIEFLNKYMDS